MASRGKSEDRNGRLPSDGELLQDIKRKREIAQAMKKYTQERYYGTKTIHPNQFSFDPHNGYGYMRLETDPALAFDAVTNSEFELRIFYALWQHTYPETAYNVVGEYHRNSGKTSS